MTEPIELRTCEVVIVCPTLNIEAGARTLAEARQMAGLDCGLLLASDLGRRGALRVGNVLLGAALDWGAEFVCYLNDDCTGFQEGWLRRLRNVLAEHPQVGVAVTGAHCRTQPQASGRPGLPQAVIELQHPSAWVCALIRADTIRQVGWLDEALRHYCDDTDFEVRMRAKGWKAVYVQDVYVQHSQGGWDNAWYAADRAYFKRKWAH